MMNVMDLFRAITRRMVLIIGIAVLSLMLLAGVACETEEGGGGLDGGDLLPQETPTAPGGGGA